MKLYVVERKNAAGKWGPVFGLSHRKRDTVDAFCKTYERITVYVPEKRAKRKVRK